MSSICCEKNQRKATAGAADCRSGVTAFLGGLPLALERDDLGWSMQLGTEKHHARAIQLGRDTGLADREEVEKEKWREELTNRDVSVPMLPAVAALDALYQDANPVRIVTSGLERIAETPFFASGKWRMVNRSRWWDEYREDVPVIVGHYWRWPTGSSRNALSKGEPDLFDGLAPQQWFGPKGNVFCADFAVGARYKARETGADQFECRLGAVRWPERVLVFDDGRTFNMAGR
jgi:hypothetical protein